MEDLILPKTLTIYPAYHGSKVKNLEKFDISFIGSGIVGYRHKNGIFFSSEIDMASYYADAIEDEDVFDLVYVCRLKMENPLIMEEEDQKSFNSRSDEIAYALSKDHDGIVFKNVIDGPLDVEGDVYVVFNPEQIEIVNTLRKHNEELRKNNEQ